MRFDAPEHVQTWARLGTFPEIHRPITQAVLEEVDPVDGDVLLDLCSSTGLLAQNLLEHGYRVVAAEQPGPALSLGSDAGVYAGVPVLALRIAGPVTLAQFLAWVEAQQVSVVVARRCFPELWDSLDGLPEYEALVRGLADAGVRMVLFEGRAVSRRTVHPLGSASAELASLAPVFQGRVRNAIGRAVRVG